MTIDQQSCSSRGECEGVRRVTLRAPILLFSKFGITSISFRQCYRIERTNLKMPIGYQHFGSRTKRQVRLLFSVAWFQSDSFKNLLKHQLKKWSFVSSRKTSQF